MIILDATAGNRHIWNRGSRGKSNLIVFMDRELKLAVPPTIFADFTMAPFRDDAFEMIVFDPPYHIRGGPNWRFNNPDMSKKGYEKSTGRWKVWGHYGAYKNRRDLVLNLINGSKEFARIGKILVFKWGEGTLTIKRALSLLKQWTPKYQLVRKGKGYHTKSRTAWITLEKNNKPPITQTSLEVTESD